MSCLHEDSIDRIPHARLSQLLAHVATAAITRKLGGDAHRLLRDLGASIDANTWLARVPHAA